MFLNESEVKEVIENRYFLDAMEMTLIRRSDPDDAFRGAGYIRQTSEGKIEYKIYDQVRAFDFPEHLLSPTVQIIPDEDFYDLELRDWMGCTWRGKQTLPHTQFGAKGVVCGGELFEIQSRESSEMPPSFLFDEL